MRCLPLVLALMPCVAIADGVFPARLLQGMRDDPQAYLQDVAAVIARAGQGDAVTEAQVATFVALTRAQARVAVLAPLMAADLDGDGAVIGTEIAAMGGSGDLGFARADANGDGQVSAAELRDLGELAALAALPPARLARVKVIMGFDADGDGAVTLNEVETGLQALVS